MGNNHSNAASDPETYDQPSDVLSAGKDMLASVSGLSFLGSCSVILTAYMFPSIFQKKVFMQIVLAVSICDFIGNLALLGGDMPQNYLCAMQGATIYFFYRASWMYTVALSHQLYELVYYGKTSLNIYHIHSIVFVINIIVEFIPLASTNYGNDDLAEGKLPCSIKGGKENNYFAGGLHDAVTFNVPILVCFFFMLFFYLRIKWKFYFQSNSLQDFPVIISAVNLVGLYPFSMMVCWVPLILYTFVVNSLDAKRWLLITYYWIFSSGCLYGFVLSIIFFSKSNEARKRWRSLFTSIFFKVVNKQPINITSGKVEGDNKEGVVAGAGTGSAGGSGGSMNSTDDDSLEEDNIDGYMEAKYSTCIQSNETATVNGYNANNHHINNFDSIEIIRSVNYSSEGNTSRSSGHFSSEVIHNNDNDNYNGGIENAQSPFHKAV